MVVSFVAGAAVYFSAVVNTEGRTQRKMWGDHQVETHQEAAARAVPDWEPPPQPLSSAPAAALVSWWPAQGPGQTAETPPELHMDPHSSSCWDPPMAYHRFSYWKWAAFTSQGDFIKGPKQEPMENPSTFLERVLEAYSGTWDNKLHCSPQHLTTINQEPVSHSPEETNNHR